MSTSSPDVLSEQRGHLGLITLNRPKAMNALTTGMVAAMLDQFQLWEHDESVSTVAVRGAGDRGLCAGGDIVAIYHDILAGGTDTARFWRVEYELNALIARYPKPYVALMDGLVLGGGIGISAHGSFRVVTERTRAGMPETTIGFVPDVGGTYLLSRSPGETGTYAALTAAHLNAADAIFLGLADTMVESSQLDALVAALAEGDAADVVGQFAVQVPDSGLAPRQQWIDTCFASDDVGEIIHQLQNQGPDAAEMAADLLAKSPTAVSVTLAALRRAADLSLEETLQQDYRVGLRFLGGPDFREGIRAQVIDKDRTPQWRPATVGEIRQDAVDRYFEPLGADELLLNAHQHRGAN